MQGSVKHRVGALSPTDSLADVVAVLRDARDWSCEVDEQLRRAGCQPDGGVLGLPLAQVDAILVITERTLAQALELEMIAHRARRLARRGFWCGVAAAIIAVVSFLISVWRFL